MIGIMKAKAPQMFKVIVTRRVHGRYIWDHFQCRDSFVLKFLRKEMKWSLRRSTRPGKKTPDNVSQILTDTFLRLSWAISKFKIPAALIVNSDQTLVYFAASAKETYAPIGSKQVEAVGMDERRGFTLLVGISMSGEVLPFQAIYRGQTKASLPSVNAPEYERATEELEFHFESSKTNNHWSTIDTMKSYVTNILAPYFHSHLQQLRLPNQICVWQIDCWSVHRSLEFRSWMTREFPWICIHFIPENCTGLFQPCDVGIQRVLKLAIKRSALSDVIDNTMGQLKSGVTPDKVTFEKRMEVVRNRSVRWLVNGYEAINNPEIVQKVIFPYDHAASCLLILPYRLLDSAQLEQRVSTSPMSL